MAAATARQTSTSRPVQLPLSSGDEKPGRPWLTPQDSMPRSLTVLRVCAEAAWAEKPAATARVRTRDTRFMGKCLSGSRAGTFACYFGNIGLTALQLLGQPDDPSRKYAKSDRQCDVRFSQAMDLRSRQAPQRAATGSCDASQNDWRARSRG